MVDLFRSSNAFTSAGGLSKRQIAGTEVGMAHFANTGETSEFCNKCAFWRKRRDNERKRYCHKYIQLTGDDKKAITGNAYSCKYFQFGPEKRKSGDR